MLHHRPRLLWRRNPRPHWKKRSYIFIRRALPVFKVIVKVQTAVAVPKIFLDSFLALLCLLCPVFRIRFATQALAHLLQIFFRLVQQAVQAHWRIMVRSHAVRPKSKRYVVSRFPHRAVALVIIRAQRRHACGVARSLPHSLGGVAHLQREQGPYMWLIGLLRNHVISPFVLLLTQKESCHLPVVPRLVFHALGCRPISKIVVSR